MVTLVECQPMVVFNWKRRTKLRRCVASPKGDVIGEISLAKAALLGLVQGLTEFLPVSSSGHLVLVGDLVDVPATGLAFELLLHAGTLMAVIWYYRG